MAAIMGLAVGAMPAAGAEIEIAFSGIINYVEAGLPLSDTIAIGTPFSGTYSYESGAADTSPNNPIVGAYCFPNHSMVAWIGDTEFAGPDIVLAVYNYSSFDIYGVSTLSTFSVYGVEWESMNIDLVNNTGTALTSDELPLDAPDLDDFALGRTFDLIRPFQIGSSISGEITWMGLVPEPGTLLALSAGALLVVRRDSRGRFDGRYGRVN